MAKLKAFTLFESVVAIAIIAVLIAIATMTYGNLVEAEKPLSYYQGKNEIDRLLINLKQEKNYVSKTLDYESYAIVQHISQYKGNKNLIEVEYQLKSGTKIWWKEKHLVVNEGNK